MCIGLDGRHVVHACFRWLVSTWAGQPGRTHDCTVGSLLRSECLRMPACVQACGAPVGAVAVWHEDLALGTLSDWTAVGRCAALQSMGIELPDDFVRAWESFCDLMARARAIRVWRGSAPYEVMGEYALCTMVSPAVRVVAVDVDRCGLIDQGALGIEAFDDAVRSAKDVDVVGHGSLWRSLPAGGLLRTLEDGVPAPCDVDAFDDVVRGAIDRCGTGDLVGLGVQCSVACREAAGGEINPEFFIERARRLSRGDARG